MKFYIFLTTSIARVGGAQLYIARKANFLIEDGWEVMILHYAPGEIMIDFNKQIKTRLKYELAFTPSLFSKKRVDKILDAIANYCVGTDSEVVIESHTINLALWGEVLAPKIKGKHLIYLLSEKFPALNNETINYLKFKYDINSLFGITPVSLKQIFTIEGNELAYLNAIGCSNNNVDDVPNDLMDNYKKSDWNILSIGRLDKEYIVPVFQSLANYADFHKDKHISLILVGGAYRKHNHKRAVSIFKRCRNVSIVDVGYSWPIPLSCFHNSDLTIASSGSAMIAESVGSPVIVIDGNDYMPIGIYGRTTNSFVFRKSDEPPIELSSLLDDVLISKKYVNNIRYENEKELDYSSHMNVLNNIPTEYYPMSKILRLGASKFKRVLMLLIGAKKITKAYYLHNRLNDIIKRIKIL